VQKPGIAVLDFGSQYTQTIARRFRQLNTFSEIFEPETWPAEFVNARGIVLSGGPNSVYQPDAPRCNHELFDIGKPIWGICYGFQYIAYNFGGKVERKERGEYGKAQLNIHKNVGVLENLGTHEQGWMSHGDTVTKLPPGYEAIASTDDCEYAVAWNPDKKIIGTQFHPEVDDTPNGMRMLDNFLRMCGATEHDWTMENYINESRDIIREQAHGRKVCHLTSGGGEDRKSVV
jgi:GMP synthase (glutamine-hydrolysing)